MTIHDVEEKDLNVSYACSVAIYEYTNILLPHYNTVLFQVVPETSMSTKLSMSTEPSISSNTTIGSKDEIILIIVILLGILIGGTIVAYHRSRIKKLLMGIMGK